eukprot:751268-Hanusia_phi.AAC.3
MVEAMSCLRCYNHPLPASHQRLLLLLLLGLSVVARAESFADLSQVDRSLSQFDRILQARDGQQGDRFGRSVALTADLALVGADYAPCSLPLVTGDCNISGRGSGAVYVFAKDYVDEIVGGYNDTGYRDGSRQEWRKGFGSLRKEIVPPDSEAGQRFGSALSVDEIMNTVLVGAPLKTVGSGSQSGMAFVYQKDKGGLDNWGLVSSFSLENTSYIVEGYEHFGTSAMGEMFGNGQQAWLSSFDAPALILPHTNVTHGSFSRSDLIPRSSLMPWQELVPEPDGTTGPFWCASPLSTTGKAGKRP